MADEIETLTVESGEVAALPPEPVDPVLQLLRDVAESEHQLRRPEAFAALCAGAGYAVVVLPHKVDVEKV